MKIEPPPEQPELSPLHGLEVAAMPASARPKNPCHAPVLGASVADDSRFREGWLSRRHRLLRRAKLVLRWPCASADRTAVDAPGKKARRPSLPRARSWIRTESGSRAGL